MTIYESNKVKMMGLNIILFLNQKLILEDYVSRQFEGISLNSWESKVDKV